MTEYRERVLECVQKYKDYVSRGCIALRLTVISILQFNPIGTDGMFYLPPPVVFGA